MTCLICEVRFNYVCTSHAHVSFYPQTFSASHTHAPPQLFQVWKDYNLPAVCCCDWEEAFFCQLPPSHGNIRLSGRVATCPTFLSGTDAQFIFELIVQNETKQTKKTPIYFSLVAYLGCWFIFKPNKPHIC